MSRGKRRFDGRVAVITGGAGGIGRALGRRFARARAHVALLDLPTSPLDEARADVAAAAPPGTEVLALACDVTDEPGCRRAVHEVVQRLGGVDVLMNNAGAVHRSVFADTTLAVYRKVFEVNVFGALHCTKAALPSLLERRGLIVVTSSVAGLAPLYGRSGYAGSKHALHGIFESAATELEPRGVDVLMVCPTFTASGFEAAAMGPDGRPLGRPRTKIGKLAQPDDVAEAVFRAAERRQRRLVLSAVGRAAALLSRLTPRLYERLMVRGLHADDAPEPAAGRGARDDPNPPPGSRTEAQEAPAGQGDKRLGAEAWPRNLKHPDEPLDAAQATAPKPNPGVGGGLGDRDAGDRDA